MKMKRVETREELTSIFRAENDHLLLGKVDGDRGAGGHASGVAVGGEAAGVENGVVWVEVLELLAGGADEHVAHEEGVVGSGANNADVDAVALVPAGEAIDDVDAGAGIEVVDGTLAVDFPNLLVNVVQLCFYTRVDHSLSVCIT